MTYGQKSRAASSRYNTFWQQVRQGLETTYDIKPPYQAPHFKPRTIIKPPISGPHMKPPISSPFQYQAHHMKPLISGPPYEAPNFKPPLISSPPYEALHFKPPSTSSPLYQAISPNAFHLLRAQIVTFIIPCYSDNLFDYVEEEITRSVSYVPVTC